MRFLSQQRPGSREVERFVEGEKTALWMTFPTPGQVHVGIYNVVRDGGKFYLHIGRRDEQAVDIDGDPRGMLVFAGVLSTIPSYWIDPRYGGAINQFFRYVEYPCTARRIEEPGGMTRVLQLMMDRFQPERAYDPLDAEAEIYRDKYLAISVVELTVGPERAKWNLGQTKPRAAFENIMAELEARASGTDSMTLEEMRRWDAEAGRG